MDPRKVLLIWPPVLTSNVLPLGIPFINAYLAARGAGPVPVYDMNMAYLRLFQIRVDERNAQRKDVRGQDRRPDKKDFP
ncbi:MAG: hypothetical protein ACM3L6_02085, partial [Deltaproteobacteria bacterium]